MHGIIVCGRFFAGLSLGDPHNPWHPICLIGISDQFSGKENTETFSKAAQR